MTRLSALINELETKIEHSDKLNTAVSKTAVGWHVQHSLLVALQIITAVENSNPADYQPAFNLKKFMVYTLNKIPRGKAKAPDRVMPKEPYNTAALKTDLQLLKSRLAVLSSLEKNKFFVHPMFGHLNVKATIKMLRLHTKHHLDIMNDIIKS